MTEGPEVLQVIVDPQRQREDLRRAKIISLKTVISISLELLFFFIMYYLEIHHLWFPQSGSYRC